VDDLHLVFRWTLDSGGSGIGDPTVPVQNDGEVLGDLPIGNQHSARALEAHFPNWVNRPRLDSGAHHFIRSRSNWKKVTQDAVALSLTHP
jgi:hypothetical protein